MGQWQNAIDLLYILRIYILGM